MTLFSTSLIPFLSFLSLDPLSSCMIYLPIFPILMKLRILWDNFFLPRFQRLPFLHISCSFGVSSHFSYQCSLTNQPEILPKLSSHPVAAHIGLWSRSSVPSTQTFWVQLLLFPSTSFFPHICSRFAHVLPVFQNVCNPLSYSPEHLPAFKRSKPRRLKTIPQVSCLMG